MEPKIWSTSQMMLKFTVIIMWACSSGALTGATKCPPPESIMPCRCRGRNDQIQVWCSHSDLERVNRALENLMSLRSIPAIDELIVENNRMPTLPARAFGALQIGRLLLRNNGLESLSRNAFAGLEDSLEEIYIVEEKLMDFPFDAVENLRNLEAFTIEKSKIRLLPRFNDLNRLKHIRIDGSMITGFPVGAFASMRSIKQIHVVNSQVTRLAEGIFGRLDSLLLANFSSNRIDHVQRRVFSRLPRLEVLSIGNNQLSDASGVGQAVGELYSLKSLDLSNNALKDLPESSFVNLRSLQLLNLAGNGIARVYSRSFTHLPALRKVDLSRNLLRHFPRMLFDTTPLLEELRIRENLLGSPNDLTELFGSLRSLRYLDIGDNGITDLPTGAIKDHTHLQTLDLSDNRISKISFKAFKNLPSLQELSFKNNSISSLDVDIWDLSALKEVDFSENAITLLTETGLKGVPSIQRIDFSYNSMNSLQSGTFLPTSKLEYLDFKGNSISSINSNAFMKLENLVKLDLSKNHLTTLPTGLFRDMMNLLSLNLASNRLTSLPADLITHLKKLEDLNLRSNSISHIPTGFFQNSMKLKEINFKHNAIASVPARSFAGLPDLESLKLSSNQIGSFDDNAFDDLVKLRVLDLSNNRIVRLSARSFRNLPLLEKFEARENRISVMEPGIMGNTETLQILDLARNALTSVPEVIQRNHLIKVIDLSHNQIQSLKATQFKGLSSLMELYVNENKINTVEVGTFQNQASLTILDLDGNELEEITTHMFYNLPRLIYLRISRNRVKGVAKSGFSNLNALDGLDFQENELEEIHFQGFENTSALKYLNLSHNNFDNMHKMGLQALGSLEVLDISFNKLTKLEIEAIKHLIWLVELRINDNGICTISPGTFDGMSRLKMLVIRNNRLRNLYESVFYKLRNNIAFLDISGNPLECDCEMTWLRNLIAREAIQELSDSTCESPLELKGTAVKAARPGRMICAGHKRHYDERFQAVDCPALEKSKRRPRPANLVDPDEKPIFGTNIRDGYFDHSQNSITDNRRSDSEKRITSSDYTPGDTPTIYAGSSISQNTNPGQTDSPKSSSGSILSSIFGIPIDFGLNLGISPSFTWSGNNGNKHKEHKKPGLPTQDALPANWLHRPSKISGPGGALYEAPEYLPRKPSQPYIPLNPNSHANAQGAIPLESQPVIPSGSVDVHQAVKSPHKIKFPSDAPKHPSWHPNYPTTETGFIPIEPFFHNNMRPNKTIPTTTVNEVFINQLATPVTMATTETPTISTEGYQQHTQDYLEEEEGTHYTPVKIQHTTEKKNDISLSDFWNIFATESASTSNSSSSANLNEESNSEEDSDDHTYYDDGLLPFNFSAPVDQPMEPEYEPEYNIPFGEPNNAVGSKDRHNVNVHVTGKPTITKIIEADPLTTYDADKFNSFNFGSADFNKNHTSIDFDTTANDRPGSSQTEQYEDQRNNEKPENINSRKPDSVKEELTGTPHSSPLVPPVIIGRNDAEPRDWYYTNYHKSSHRSGDDILERLLERSKLQEQLVNLNGTGSSHKKFHCAYLLPLILYFLL